MERAKWSPRRHLSRYLLYKFAEIVSEGTRYHTLSLLKFEYNDYHCVFIEEENPRALVCQLGHRTVYTHYSMDLGCLAALITTEC